MQYYMQYSVITEHIITAHDCIWIVQCILYFRMTQISWNCNNSIEFKAWISNYIHINWDLITQPCLNYDTEGMD